MVKVQVSPAKWTFEHRDMAGFQLGRHLEKHERVHHRNGNRAENTVGPCLTESECRCGVEPKHNLELWKVKTHGAKDPPGVRSGDYHCPGCRCEGSTSRELALYRLLLDAADKLDQLVFADISDRTALFFAETVRARLMSAAGPLPI